MFKRILAIAAIFVCTALAWFILAGTIQYRSDSFRSSLESRVASSWGTPQAQCPPAATYAVVTEVLDAAQKPVRSVSRVALPLQQSRVNVRLDLEHRQKGLLWYSTYAVAYSGLYTFHNTSGQDQMVTFSLPFPAERAVYDDLEFTVDGKPAPLANASSAATAMLRIAADQDAVVRVGYRSQGLGSWHYRFGGEVTQVRDFVLKMTTNFRDIDFPENTLSPTQKRPTPGGWELTWSYKNLVSGFDIGMTMPEKLQPGPLAGQISVFAPVSLLFFFFLMFIITTMRGIELHPMNYFFLACAFFSFHLLLAYLVDRISIHTAFAICSAVSIFLVISYLRLVVGMRFAAVEAGLAQLIYLVLFSYAFFWKGFTGLAITIGSILTLFLVMQMTGRIRWAEKFARPAPPGPPPGYPPAPPSPYGR